MVLLLFILIFPLLEISVFIHAGDVIGAGPVILLTVGTAIWGMAMVRLQGMETYRKMQQSMANGETPAFEMLEGTLILLAGLMLLLPGFITDTMGILLLIPPLRRKLIQWNFIPFGRGGSGWSSIQFGNRHWSDRQNHHHNGRTIDQDDDQQ